MEKTRSITPHLFFFLLLLCLHCTRAMDSITPIQPIKDGQTLLSAGEEFALGFFGPGDTKNRYVGIWYHKISKRTVVWVANRENPVADSSGEFVIRSDGNLAVLDGHQTAQWSTSINSTAATNAFYAVLMDSGNLIVREGNSSSPGRILWQSFDYPTDTILPGMNIGIDPRNSHNKILQSWKSSDNPAPGSYSFGVNPQLPNQFFIWRGSVLYWRSDTWDGRTFEELPELRNNPNFNFSVVNDDQQVYFRYTSPLGNYTRITIEHSGQVTSYIWENKTERWDSVLSQPKDQCSVYAKCGTYGVCNGDRKGTQLCQCLRWFEPVSMRDWSSGVWSSGCRRQRELECGKEDEFLHFERMKFSNQESSWFDASVEGCKAECLNDCRCNAYAYSNVSSSASRCLILVGDLIDLKEEDGQREQDLYIRIGPPKSNGNTLVKSTSNKKKVIIPIALAVGVILLGAFCWLRRRMLKRKRTKEKLQLPVLNSSPGGYKFRRHKKEGLDVPSFDLKSILIATENFSDSNKLGQGGFGPVYKGILPEGQQMAVKRLSNNSGQGLEEFRNEVILIAKLQHRNLVKLLGYCFQGDEKILLYEYMPNKSLDFFLFDQTRCKLLNWEKRFNIILGIARGLLYLHQDSRLKIIHRDLKASNVLLDEEMNPKISDFGLARIFGVNQTEANTNRVVGTYGYMSPEYALDGHFSIKSDVFSFGVLLLEMVTGRKNTRTYHIENYEGLLGNVWRLWKEGNGLDLIDPSLTDQAYETSEVLRCIHVGLLCVQQEAGDRPTMASALLMLVQEVAALPTPQQPIFFPRRNIPEAESSSDNQRSSSENEITNSLFDGR